MEKVFDGRWTARMPREGGSVFLIGMRFNKLWRVDRWLPVFLAMPRMTRHLRKHPELGLKAAHTWFGRTVVVLMYWRSADDLIDFAAARSAPHLAAWQEYNRAVGSDGSVGVWHETYLVEPGKVEGVYVNMPRFGLGEAFEHERITRDTNNSRKRLAASGPR